MINYSDPQTRYLIDYANLKQGLIKHQNDFLDEKKFKNFSKKKYLGCPLVLPIGIKFFDYRHAKKFKISKNEVKKFVFECNSNNYVGLKIFFKYGSIFCTGAKLKKKYLNDFKSIIRFNHRLKLLIKKKKKKKLITSFQTRNIPHLGHELILNRLLGKKKLLFINPLIGIKKKGDIRNEVLKKVFNYLKKLKCYKTKMLYAPVICNMNYAGPREALHHTYLREKLGFNQFTIGRDHAGAEKNYLPHASKKFVKKNKKRFNINIFYHNGAYYCKKCKMIVLKGDCNHKVLQDISGSEFRKKLEKKTLFLRARKTLQMYISKMDMKLFN